MWPPGFTDAFSGRNGGGNIVLYSASIAVAIPESLPPFAALYSSVSFVLQRAPRSPLNAARSKSCRGLGVVVLGQGELAAHGIGVAIQRLLGVGLVEQVFRLGQLALVQVYVGE